jgi:hypothetical protein
LTWATGNLHQFVWTMKVPRPPPPRAHSFSTANMPSGRMSGSTYWTTLVRSGQDVMRKTAAGHTTVYGEAVGSTRERDNASVQLLLVVGRDADLTPDDVARVEWRANSISLGQYRMSCMTFDGVLNSLWRRLLLASQAS